MKTAKASGRLGTQLRGKLATAYGVRGHQNSALWYVYSPRTDRDWVLRSDLCFDHFVLTEADPTVIDVDYAPELAFPGLEAVGFAAIVRYNDGATQWHHVSSEDAKPNSQAASRLLMLSDAAEHAGAKLQCFTEPSLHENDLWLWNWKRAITWISAARGTALAPYMTDLAAFIHPRGTMLLSDIAQFGAQDLFPLYVAAAFRLVQRGDLLSDLDEFPVSISTRFHTRG